MRLDGGPRRPDGRKLSAGDGDADALAALQVVESSKPLASVIATLGRQRRWASALEVLQAERVRGRLGRLTVSVRNAVASSYGRVGMWEAALSSAAVMRQAACH